MHVIGIESAFSDDGLSIDFVRIKLFSCSGAKGYDVAARMPEWKKFFGTNLG